MHWVVAAHPRDDDLAGRDSQLEERPRTTDSLGCQLEEGVPSDDRQPQSDIPWSSMKQRPAKPRGPPPLCFRHASERSSAAIRIHGLQFWALHLGTFTHVTIHGVWRRRVQPVGIAPPGVKEAKALAGDALPGGRRHQGPPDGGDIFDHHHSKREVATILRHSWFLFSFPIFKVFLYDAHQLLLIPLRYN